jgi:PAS domain S-box-containing protein
LESRTSLKTRFIVLVCLPLAVQAIIACVVIGWLLHMESIVEFHTSKEVLAMLVGGGLVVNLAFVAFLGLQLGKDISDRFAILTDNVDRFRRQEKLNYLQGGDDELAILDQSFHEMAAALNQAIASERDLIESAASIICAINGEFIIDTINPAAEKLLGFTPQKLIGSSVLGLLTTEGQELLLETLYQVRYSGAESVLDIPLKVRSGNLIDSFWMIKWSKDKNLWICVVQDISERKLAENMRRQIVNMVSHDIRSPLSTINVIFASLQMGVYGALSPKAVELTQSGERACAQLLNLTGDLLALDKLEAGMLLLEYSEVDLDQLLVGIQGMITPFAEKARVIIKHHSSGLSLMADRDRLDQILTNLITNAIKFSKPGGVVHLHASQIGSEIEIVVKDQGIGIAENHLPFIFDRYRQVRTTDATKKKGSGLGLSIAKALTELHGGRIAVASEVGKGTSFYVRLPKAGKGS